MALAFALAVGLQAGLVAGLPVPARAELPIPELTGRVVDRADLLPAGAARALEDRLAAFERETSHQIVVLTLPGLEGEAIESFSIRVAQSWKIGQQGRDNGVIVIVAAADRRARIEVGYGLEGVIPDAVAARILRERMIPEFRRGAMDAGIVSGVEALMAAARGEAMPAPTRRERSPGGAGFVHAILFGTIFGGVVGAFFGRHRPLRAALVSGGLAAGITFLFTAALWAALVAGSLGALFGLSPSGRGQGLGRGGAYGPYGGWGGGFGGGFGGGGFGGGFGGGGGGFGGGGASGSW